MLENLFGGDYGTVGVNPVEIDVLLWKLSMNLEIGPKISRKN